MDLSIGDSYIFEAQKGSFFCLGRPRNLTNFLQGKVVMYVLVIIFEDFFPESQNSPRKSEELVLFKALLGIFGKSLILRHRGSRRHLGPKAERPGYGAAVKAGSVSVWL